MSKRRSNNNNNDSTVENAPPLGRARLLRLLRGLLGARGHGGHARHVLILGPPLRGAGARAEHAASLSLSLVWALVQSSLLGRGLERRSRLGGSRGTKDAVRAGVISKEGSFVCVGGLTGRKNKN